MTTVTATFEVSAGHTADSELDVANMTPNEIAAWLDENGADGISLCHQCGHDINDPQIGKLVEFEVDGRHYVFNDNTGNWTEWTPS
jgi:hypothetical protein